jgi:hypothetical protein
MTIRAIHEWSSKINRTTFMRFRARKSILLPCPLHSERLSSSNGRALVNRQSISR